MGRHQFDAITGELPDQRQHVPYQLAGDQDHRQLWAKVLNQIHPNYEEKGVDPDCIDYGDAPNHVTSAHFNLYWASNDPGCQDPIEAPTDKEVGLLECVYFTLDLGMISPLSHASIYRDHPDYDHLTHISVYKGKDSGTGQLATGLIYGVQATYSVFAHELFHVFDYAGNPLHNKDAFDQRYENNAYHFYHKSVTKIEQTMARDAKTFGDTGRIPGKTGFRWT